MESKRVNTPDGISWYLESFPPTNKECIQNKEYIVLIPSGEGDCYSMRTVAQILSSSGPYHVLSFDMPGMSRTTAPPEAYAKVTPDVLAKQIIGLMDELQVPRATFYGCSSGACATIGLCALYPSRTKCGILHEAPLSTPPLLSELMKLSDGEIIAASKDFFANGLIEKDINDGLKKWEALGPEYHARLEKNYVPWLRGYCKAIEVGGIELASVPENLQKRPMFWTVGSLNPGIDKGEGPWAENFVVAQKAGFHVNTTRLNSLHFPSVTIPEELAAWIQECVEKIQE